MRGRLPVSIEEMQAVFSVGQPLREIVAWSILPGVIDRKRRRVYSGSLSEADRLIEAGEIAVDGEVVFDPHAMIEVKKGTCITNPGTYYGKKTFTQFCFPARFRPNESIEHPSASGYCRKLGDVLRSWLSSTEELSLSSMTLGQIESGKVKVNGEIVRDRDFEICTIEPVLIQSPLHKLVLYKGLTSDFGSRKPSAQAIQRLVREYDSGAFWSKICDECDEIVSAGLAA